MQLGKGHLKYTQIQIPQMLDRNSPAITVKYLWTLQMLTFRFDIMILVFHEEDI